MKYFSFIIRLRSKSLQSIMLLITLISILILNTEGLDGTLSEWIDLQCEVYKLNMTNLYT